MDEPRAEKPVPLDFILQEDLTSTPVYVILQSDAMIRRQPAQDSDTIAATRLPTKWSPGNPTTTNSLGAGILARVHKETESYLEVETLPGNIDGLPCHPSPRHSPYSLRGFVRKEKGVARLFEVEEECFSERSDGGMAEPGETGTIGLGNMGTIGSGGGGGHCSWSRGSPDWDIPVGAEVFWPAGQKAGKVLFGHTFMCTDPQEQGGNLCFRSMRFSPDEFGPNHDVPLCFKESAITKIDAKTALGRKLFPVKIVKVVTNGENTKEMIRRIVQRHVGELRFCYERESIDEPLGGGGMVVDFGVSADGTAQSAKVIHSSFKADGLEKCVQGAVNRWTFPPTKLQSSVKLKLHFGDRG